MNKAIEILAVDDSRVQATMLRNLLQAHGYSVTVAGDGREALEAARRQKPDLIISDIMMPIMDGYAMCRALKQDAVLCDVPVILLTNLSDPEDIIRGLDAKADYYLTKPYNHDYLLATLQALLANPPWRQSTASPDDLLSDSPHAPGRLEVTLAGKAHVITASRQQMLNLLLSTYGNAVQQNRELTKTKQTLEALNQHLTEQTQQIERQQLELRAANEQLHEMATSDGLTGLKNQRAFKERLAEEFHRASRYSANFSVLLVDVDRFKLYNDTFGNPAGDGVLREVGRLLQATARDTDFAARCGGEEFVMLLPNTGYAAAYTLAERLRTVIETAPWKERAITVSIGVATMPPAIASSDMLIEEADKALYHSKSSGRNRVTHAHDMIVSESHTE